MVLPGLALNDEGNPNDERMIPPGFARYLDLIGVFDISSSLFSERVRRSRA